MRIRNLKSDELPPWGLLELADPSRIIVEGYVKSGSVYVGEEDGIVIGVYVLKKTEKVIVEIMNLAVQEGYRGKGLGKQLIFHAINEASRRGYAQLEIGTGNSSIYQ